MPHISDPAFKKEVGERLRRTREALDDRPNQAKFAKALEISKSRLNNYELGIRMLDPAVAVTICEKYGATLDWLYRGLPDRLPSYLSERLFGVRFDSRRA